MPLLAVVSIVRQTPALSLRSAEPAGAPAREADYGDPGRPATGNLYVFVRAFDPHPDSIITVVARPDYFTPSDMIWLFLDSYHDRRTGFEFGVNPSGVKLDAQIYNDGTRTSRGTRCGTSRRASIRSTARPTSTSRSPSCPMRNSGATCSVSLPIAICAATPNG